MSGTCIIIHQGHYDNWSKDDVTTKFIIEEWVIFHDTAVWCMPGLFYSVLIPIDIITRCKQNMGSVISIASTTGPKKGRKWDGFLHLFPTITIIRIMVKK